MKKLFIILIIVLIGIYLIYHHHEDNLKDSNGVYYAHLNETYELGGNNEWFGHKIPPINVTSINVDKKNNTITLKTDSPYTDIANCPAEFDFYCYDQSVNGIDLDTNYINNDGKFELVVSGDDGFEVSNITKLNIIPYCNFDEKSKGQPLVYKV